MSRVLAIAGLMLAAGCAVGPDYVRPTAPSAPAYKELAGWKAAEPRDAIPRTGWWTMFGDPTLDALEEQVAAANQDLAAAEARFREASALVSSARAAFYPTVTAGVSFSRSKPPRQSPVSEYAMPLAISWEIDVWGRIRRAVESSAAGAQATAGDLAATQLSLEAQLALDYFQLRTVDADSELLAATVATFEKSLALTQNRHAGGVASAVDVVLAEAQLEATRAQAIDLGATRAALEHAIAVLVGTPASAFGLPAAPLDATPPDIPAGLPAALLERRPDVAAAERRVAAANAQIGVAQAAWYPTVTLSASGGFSGSDLSKWLVWPSRFWAVGPAITETVYDGGLRSAQTAQARAVYDETVATYRETALVAFQEVEDQLAALRVLADEAGAVDASVRAADESEHLEVDRYKAGVVSYLEVAVVQATALANQRSAVDVAGRRMGASVALVQALGGGFAATDLPAAKTIAADDP
jgi:NodT family efflux transporter outer membrane factor (OMF) lipoprotein